MIFLFWHFFCEPDQPLAGKVQLHKKFGNFNIAQKQVKFNLIFFVQFLKLFEVFGMAVPSEKNSRVFLEEETREPDGQDAVMGSTWRAG